MAFTINEANWCIKRYWRQRGRNKEVSLEGGWDAAFALQDYLSNLLSWRSDKKLQNLAAAAQLQLFDLLMALDRRPDHVVIYILRLLGMAPWEIMAYYWVTPLAEVVREAKEKFLVRLRAIQLDGPGA